MLNCFVFVYLDDILIFSRNLQEHVQHVNLVLKRLLENRSYVKAEKCDFHVSSVCFLGFIVEKGQIKTDPAKVKAVAEWPTPTSRKQLQRFLGFANFYRRFIRDYSRVATPLTQLTSVKVPFVWCPAAEVAFTRLKLLFSSAPVLIHPDPTSQFIVEVDASDSGVGAVLSQRSTSDLKQHPCAFFSRQHSPAERNYEVGNRELLAVVLALQEWRHWLEGSTHPFIVWSDHKNLSYLRSARRLNSRQAWWALFLGRFHFTLTYRPGSKNIKTDALSRQFALPVEELWKHHPAIRLCGWSSRVGDQGCGPGGPEGPAGSTGLSTRQVVCTRGGEISCPSMGTRLPDCLPSWVSAHTGVGPEVS